MFFNLFKPKPKFELGQIVERFSDNHPGCRYAMIIERLFVRPKGHKKKQWMYHGALVRIVAGRNGQRDEMFAVTQIYYMQEDHLAPVEGLEPPGFKNRKFLL